MTMHVVFIGFIIMLLVLHHVCTFSRFVYKFSWILVVEIDFAVSSAYISVLHVGCIDKSFL